MFKIGSIDRKARITTIKKGEFNMSRIGKKPIEIPSGVEIKIEGNVITAKGPCLHC